MTSSSSKLSGRVLVVGDVMEDIIVKLDGPMVRGSDVRAKIRTLPGGSGANQAMWLAALTVPVNFLARVGAADLDRYRTHFVSRGVRAILVPDRSLPTGRLVSLIDVDGERSFLTDRGANTALSPADAPADILDGIGLLHVSGYAFFEDKPRATALHLIGQARAAGIPVSIDPASVGFLAEVGAEQFLASTQGATFFFPNTDEAELLSGTNDPVSQIAILGEYYGLVVLKRGAEGAIVGTREGVIAKAPGLNIDVVDTTGAGDAFFAGFLSVLRRGGSLDQSLAAANAEGARAATQLGGQPDE